MDLVVMAKPQAENHFFGPGIFLPGSQGGMYADAD
jgi:hypothetical protein